jgi:hypothetical protein
VPQLPTSNSTVKQNTPQSVTSSSSSSAPDDTKGNDDSSTVSVSPGTHVAHLRDVPGARPSSSYSSANKRQPNVRDSPLLAAVSIMVEDWRHKQADERRIRAVLKARGRHGQGRRRAWSRATA